MGHTPRNRLGLVLAVACLFSGACERAPRHQADSGHAPPTQLADTQRPPNIILILADDQAPGTLGIEGNAYIHTPQLDRLTQEGTFFSRAYVPIPQCAPSRAALLTGLYPHQNGVLANKPAPRLKADAVTFPQLLKDKGYACGLVGKWHLGNEQRPQAGFDDLWVSPVNQAKACYLNPVMWVNGQELQHTGHQTGLLADYAIRFIQEHAQRPFLLWLAFQAPHGPYNPPPSWRRLYRPADLPLPASISDDLSAKPTSQRDDDPHGFFQDVSPHQLKQQLAQYYAHISDVDHQVGRLLERLDELDLTHNTLVVYLSDNGWLTGEHQMYGKGANFYEEQVRTPLIIRWPAPVPPATRVDALVSSLDLFPTICALAHLPVPDGLPGADLRPLLTDPSTHGHKALFFEYHRSARRREIPLRGLVTSHHKYVHYLQGGQELYDLSSDPQEMNNLIDHPDYGSIAETLRDKLAHWRAATGDTP